VDLCKKSNIHTVQYVFQGEYAVKYYDGMSATVKEDFLQELDPMSLPRMRTRPRPKPADSPAQVEYVISSHVKCGLFEAIRIL